MTFGPGTVPSRKLDRARAESNGRFAVDLKDWSTGPPIGLPEGTKASDTPPEGEPDYSNVPESLTPRLWIEPHKEWVSSVRPSAAMASVGDDLQQQILRAHFVQLILDALRKIQPHIGAPSSITYINSLFRAVRQMMERSPDDPFLEVLLGFYDALTFDNNWMHYTANQYAQAYDVLKQFSSQRRIQTDDVERAIMDLEDIGFDTTPYPLEIVEEEG